MIGLVRMGNTQYALQDVVASGVPGDFLEAGVWRGGACILALGAFTALDQPQRRVWVVDSFEGLPPPDAAAFPVDEGDGHHAMGALLSVSVEQVAENFLRYGFNVNAPAIRERVRFVKGFFADTLPSIDVEVRMARLRRGAVLWPSLADPACAAGCTMRLGVMGGASDPMLHLPCRPTWLAYPPLPCPALPFPSTLVATRCPACCSAWRFSGLTATCTRARGRRT